MTATDVTIHRDAVRRRIAQVAAGIVGAAIAVLLLAISSIPVDPPSEFDTAGGTRSYPDLGTIGLLISVSALTIPIASAIGTTFGRGSCRGFCGVVLALVAMYLHAQLT